MPVSEKAKSISFIIPTYNAGRHIECCLKSIRSQKYLGSEVEILVIDGGSTDNTLEIAKRFGSKILNNPRRLAEYGVQIGIREASGEFSVVFAADNELSGNDWIKKVIETFEKYPDVCAVWGRLVSGENDTPLNKYFELIQSDPLNWFLNKNLDQYKKNTRIKGTDIFLFRVEKNKPLVWGANVLVYKADKIKRIWDQEGYLGDNDAFQYMIEQGNNKVAYFNTAFVYHHHVARLSDWVKKWRRNFIQHLLNQHKTRNLGWLFAGNFKGKLLIWIIYSSIPIFSLSHSVYLFIRDRNIHWFYHPMVSFLQFLTYCSLILSSKKGFNFVKGLISNNA